MFFADKSRFELRALPVLAGSASMTLYAVTEFWPAVREAAPYLFNSIGHTGLSWGAATVASIAIARTLQKREEAAEMTPFAVAPAVGAVAAGIAVTALAESGLFNELSAASVVSDPIDVVSGLAGTAIGACVVRYNGSGKTTG